MNYSGLGRLFKNLFVSFALVGRVCYGGLDLSSTMDITTFVLVFPPHDEEDKYYLLPYFWVPEDTLKLRARKDHVHYNVWLKQGFLHTTEGNVIHYGSAPAWGRPMPSAASRRG